jgi:hypothetical protein
LFISLQVLGFGLSFMDADIDIDADLDADVDADAEVSIDAAEAGLLLHFLTWFHVGKVPVSVILSLFFYAFGFGGLFATTYLGKSHSPSTEMLLLLSLPVAFLIGAVVTKSLGGVIGRVLPGYESKRMNPTRLMGQIAQIDSVAVNHESGRGHVKDKDGDIHTVFLRLLSADEPVLSKKESVRLLRYKAEKGHCLCRSLTDEEESAQGTPGAQSALRCSFAG